MLFSGVHLATTFVISFRDGRPLGTTARIQTLIQASFPGVVFRWTMSGLEKLRLAKERGIESPPAVRQGMESFPSLLEGVAEGDGWRVDFGLGYLDPVTELSAEGRGTTEDLQRGLDQIARALGTPFRIHGTPAAE